MKSTKYIEFDIEKASYDLYEYGGIMGFSIRNFEEKEVAIIKRLVNLLQESFLMLKKGFDP